MSHGALLEAIEAALAVRSGHQQGTEVRYRCAEPDHEDRHPSALWHRQRHVWWCPVCGVGGGSIKLAQRLGIVVGRRKPTSAERRVMAERAADRRKREARSSALRSEWLEVLAELREAQDDVVLVRALMRDDPDERNPRTTAALDRLGDPYLRELLAEQRLDEIEAADRARREEVRGAGA